MGSEQKFDFGTKMGSIVDRMANGIINGVDATVDRLEAMNQNARDEMIRRSGRTGEAVQHEVSSQSFRVFTDTNKVVVNYHGYVSPMTVEEISKYKDVQQDLYIQILDNLKSIKNGNEKDIILPVALLPDKTHVVLVSGYGELAVMNRITRETLIAEYYQDWDCNNPITEQYLSENNSDNGIKVFKKDIVGGMLQVLGNVSVLQRDEAVSIVKENSPAHVTMMMLSRRDTLKNRYITLPEVDYTDAVTMQECSKFSVKKIGFHFKSLVPMTILPSRVTFAEGKPVNLPGLWVTEDVEGFYKLYAGRKEIILDSPIRNTKDGFCVCVRNRTNDEFLQGHKEGDSSTFNIQSVGALSQINCEDKEHSFIFYPFKCAADIYLCNNFLPMIIAKNAKLTNMLSNCMEDAVDFIKGFLSATFGNLTREISIIYARLLIGLGFRIIGVDRSMGTVVALDNEGNQVLIKAAVYSFEKPAPEGPIRFGKHYATFIPLPKTHFGLMVYGLESVQTVIQSLQEMAEDVEELIPDANAEMRIANDLLYYIARGDYIGYLIMNNYLKKNYSGYNELPENVKKEVGVDEETTKLLGEESSNNTGNVLDPVPI